MSAKPKTAIGWGGETEFEKRRGVSKIEIRPGYAQVHISNCPGDLAQARLDALDAIAQAGISLDFLKLTPTGMSFLLKESESEEVTKSLKSQGAHLSVRPNRSIVMVHAVNIRDEEGMLANLVHSSISSTAKVDHISDMHDRLLIVAESADAERLRERIEADAN